MYVTAMFHAAQSNIIRVDLLEFCPGTGTEQNSETFLVIFNDTVW